MIPAATACVLVVLSWAAHALLLPANVRFGLREGLAGLGLAVLTSGGAILAGAEGWTAALIAPAAFAGAVSTISDLRLRLVPDLSAAVVLVCALVNAAFTGGGPALAAAIGAGLLSAAILALAGRLVRRNGTAGIGAGDVLLAGAWGCWAPIELAPYALVAASAAAAGAYVLERALCASADPRIAFAPSIVGSFLGVWAISLWV